MSSCFSSLLDSVKHYRQIQKERGCPLNTDEYNRWQNTLQVSVSFRHLIHSRNRLTPSVYGPQCFYLFKWVTGISIYWYTALHFFSYRLDVKNKSWSRFIKGMYSMLFSHTNINHTCCQSWHNTAVKLWNSSPMWLKMQLSHTATSCLLSGSEHLIILCLSIPLRVSNDARAMTVHVNTMHSTRLVYMCMYITID